MNTSSITAALIAGGSGSRLGGADKGLLPLGGVTLARRALDSLRPQSGQQIIIANRHHSEYATLGVRVLRDAWPGGAGPLAGIYTALHAAEPGDVLCVPADAPRIPPDLLERLREVRAKRRSVAACAHDGADLQPLFCLVPTTALESAHEALAAGRLSVRSWLMRLGCATADFSEWPPWAWSVNTPMEWAEVQSLHAVC